MAAPLPALTLLNIETCPERRRVLSRTLVLNEDTTRAVLKFVVFEDPEGAWSKKDVLGELLLGNASSLTDHMLLETNGLSLQFAPEEVKDDDNLVMRAVRQNPIAIRHASQRLKGNEDILREALKKEPFAYIFTSKELLQDNEIMQRLKIDPQAFRPTIRYLLEKWTGRV